MKLQKATIIVFITFAFLSTACSSKILFMGQLVDATPDQIPDAFKFSKPDPAFQIIQTDQTTYFWMASNGTVFPDGKVFDENSIADVVKSQEKRDKPNVRYFEQGRYRFVRMPSTGSIFWDVFFLYEEFDKVPNAKTLKFSSCNENDGLVYLFSYKK